MPFDLFLSKYMDNSRYFNKLFVSVEGGINAKQPKKANRYAVVRLQ